MRHWILVVLLSSGLTLGAANQDKALLSVCKTFFKPEGWTIPGVPRPGLPFTPRQPGSTFATDNIKPSPRITWVERVECQTSAGRIEIRRDRVEVAWVWRYSVRGRPYAYQVELSLLDSKTGEPVGIDYAHYYYDPDGKGIFSMEVDVADVPRERFVPAWARELGRDADR